MEGSSVIYSVSGFKGAQSIALYFGQTKNTNHLLNRNYEIFFNVNGGSYTSISKGNAPKDFVNHYFDISGIYTPQGYKGVSSQPLSSVINFRITFAGYNAWLVKYLNVDDITIMYRP